VILGLSHKLDRSLSTNTIILTGIVYSMFVSSIISLVIAFAGDKVKTITFWTMGSLANTDYLNVLTILTALLLCASLILMRSRELNAFALGEDNARSVGVNVKRVKLELLIAVSVLIGVCVSIGGTIGFVGLVSPHMTRMLTGPNHKRLLSASMLFGACFLMLADLLSRTIVRPMELPVGVVTSFIGAVAFVFIFKKSGRVG
jgi:iron complex transport system permease protein